MNNKDKVFHSYLEALAQRDLHVHTSYCDHATGEMEDYVRSALDKNLKEIGFLEHLELGAPAERRVGIRTRDIPDYWRTGRELAQKHRDRIKVSLGLEIGINLDFLDELLQIRRSWAWDHIGLSCHLVPSNGVLVNIASRSSLEAMKEADHRELTLAYYRILREHLEVFQPEFVCHLDVPRKFMTNLSHDPQVRAAIDRVLSEMARTGVALEINTSGYDWVGTPYPEAEIIKASRALGLNLVLNSDSHHPSQIGRHFDRALDYLSRILDEPGHRAGSLP